MNRVVRHASVALYLLSTALAIYVLFLIWQDRVREASGISFGADLPTLNAPDVPAFGINAALDQAEGESRDRSLTVLRNGGYSWVRQPFPWREIELAKGRFAWERWDNLVREYREHGLRLVAVLDRPPEWSRQDNNWPNRPPDRFEDFGDFVAAFASHYRGQVDYLQIWDEPNVFPNWGNRAVDPMEYTALLATAYSRAKEASPTAVVLMAGLAPNDELGGRNLSDILFLEGMYRAGAAPYFDVAAAKPYGLWYKPYGSEPDGDHTGFSRLLSWRATALAHGDGAKPIWAVEFGWNALPENWAGQASAWGQVTAEDQASYTASAFRRAQTEWPWLQVLLLQGYRPAVSADDPRTGFSVVGADDRPRPVYEAVLDLATATAAPIGFHPTDTPYAVLNGNWHSDSDQLSALPGASLVLRFVGTRIDVVVAKGPRAGGAIAVVDDKRPNRLPIFDNAALLDARARAPYQDRVTIADNLPMGEHELRLTFVSQSPVRGDGESTLAPVTIGGFYAVREHGFGLIPWLTVLLFLCFVVLTQRFLIVALCSSTCPWLRKHSAGLRHLVQLGAERLSSFRRRLSSLWRGLSTGRRDWLAFGAAVCLIAATGLLPQPFAALSAIGVVACIWLRPSALAMLLIAAAPFVNLPLHVATAEFSAAELLALTAGLVVAGRSVFGSGPWHRASARSCISSGAYWTRWAARGFNAPIALLLVASVVSTALAAQQREAWRELRTVIVEPIMLYAIIVRARQLTRDKNWNDAQYARRLVDVLVLVGFAVALIALYQYLFTSDVITAEGVRRVRAFYGSPNNLGLFLGRILPIAGYIGAIDGQRRWYLLALAFQLAALTLSFSVGAWIAVAAAALFIAIMHGWRLALLAAGSVAGAFAGVRVLLPVERFVTHLNLDQGTTKMRLLIWEGALNMLRDHPIFGVGPDNFLSTYRDRYMLPAAWREPNLSHPHNMLLDFWLRLGLLGMAAGGWLLYRYFALGLNLYSKAKQTEYRVPVVALLASMITFVAHGLVDNSFFLVDLALIFWFSCGVLEVLRREHYNTGSVVF